MFVNKTSSYKSNQFLWLVFKLLIVILCGYFIYDILANNDELKFIDFQSKMNDFDVFLIKNVVLLIFFTIINWFLEITKWKILANKVSAISWRNACKQSLASLTFSLITPNRIGEYGAKALYFKKENRKEVLLVNFVGNFYQLLMTLVVGFFGVLYLMFTFSFSFLLFQNLMILLIGIIIMILFLKFLRKKSKKINDWILKIIVSLKFKNNKSILMLSFLRYAVFSHQFYFLLMLFNLEISYINAMAGITTMYLIASSVPILSLFDFVIKGSVSILVFSLFEVDAIIIICVTTIMWIFNFVLPAIVGSYFVLQFKPATS